LTSIAGIWPLAGFWSKDEIVVSAFEHQPVLFYLALITVFMTSFYMFRAVFMTFGGEYRGGAPDEHGHGGGHSSHPHESPKVMTIPLVILAVLSIFSGLWNVTGHFDVFMGHGETHGFIEGLFHPFTLALPWISLILAGLGILLAYAMYSQTWLSPQRIGSLFKPLYTLFYRKYFFDELYENVIVKTVLFRGFFSGMEQFDRKVVDGTVNGVANTTIAGGRAVRHAQTGQLQLYALFIGIGILAILLGVVFF
jgi:NADH-quinone oxidoreductase subunit L